MEAAKARTMKVVIPVGKRLKNAADSLFRRY
jgi:hypothetical protein